MLLCVLGSSFGISAGARPSAGLMLIIHFLAFGGPPAFGGGAPMVDVFLARAVGEALLRTFGAVLGTPGLPFAGTNDLRPDLVDRADLRGPAVDDCIFEGIALGGT